MAKEIQAVQTSKGKKVAKILVGIFTPIICATEIAAAGWYAYLSEEPRSFTLGFKQGATIKEDMFVVRDITIHAHQITRAKFKLDAGSAAGRVGDKFNRFAVYDKDGNVSKIAFFYNAKSVEWHLNSDGIVVPDDPTTFFEITESSVHEYTFGFFPSKTGKFSIRLYYES